MRKIVFRSHTGYCGMDGCDFDVFPDDVTEDTLNEIAYQHALNNAEAYGIYPMESMPDDYDDEENRGWAGDQYSDNIEGWWEDYDPDKHDCLSTTGFDVAEYFASTKEH